MKNSITVKEFEKQYKKNQSQKICFLDDNYNYLTTEECAEKLKTTPTEISALCRGGHFEGAFKLGKGWRIPIIKRENEIART